MYENVYENVNEYFHLCQHMACRQKYSKTSQMTQYGRTWLGEMFSFFSSSRKCDQIVTFV